MTFTLRQAGTIAVAATFLTALVSAEVSGATARETDSAAIQTESQPQFSAEPVIQPIPLESAAAPESQTEPESAESLAELVVAQPQPAELSRELNCLAGAIYFEAKGERLPGQLAVGRVIVARSKSGRFPSSYCGVVLQPSQFSFVRGGAIPALNRNSVQWRNAVAIAQIAHAGSWQSPVEGALFFHAAYVSPGWRLRRMARIENHVFYR